MPPGQYLRSEEAGPCSTPRDPMLLGPKDPTMLLGPKDPTILLGPKDPTILLGPSDPTILQSSRPLVVSPGSRSLLALPSLESSSLAQSSLLSGGRGEGGASTTDFMTPGIRTSHCSRGAFIT